MAEPDRRNSRLYALADVRLSWIRQTGDHGQDCRSIESAGLFQCFQIALAASLRRSRGQTRFAAGPGADENQQRHYAPSVSHRRRRLFGRRHGHSLSRKPE